MNNIGDLSKSITTLVGVQNRMKACNDTLLVTEAKESNMGVFKQLY